MRNQTLCVLYSGRAPSIGVCFDEEDRWILGKGPNGRIVSQAPGGETRLQYLRHTFLVANPKHKFQISSTDLQIVFPLLVRLALTLSPSQPVDQADPACLGGYLLLECIEPRAQLLMLPG
tara:strand:+ start:2213 stop:2572 length:360 start_codon:yes stop_codon:yes gene_type:complete